MSFRTKASISTVLNWVVFFAAQFLITILSLLPHRVLHVTVGYGCYFFTYAVIRYRYHVVVQNLSRSFPEKPYSEIHTLAKGFYWHFADLMVDMIKSVSIGRRQLEKQVRIVNVDLLEYYRKQGRPMVALLGHYGNWECLNILASKLPFQVNALYKPLSNTLFCRVMRRIRSRFGMQLIPANRALRQLIKTKGDGALNLFIADQFPGRDNGQHLKFLNQRTLWFDGAEKLAKAIDAVVLYVELEKKSVNGWDVHFSVIAADARQTATGEITQRFGERLEQTITRAPAYWLWSHRRWK